MAVAEQAADTGREGECPVQSAERNAREGRGGCPATKASSCGGSEGPREGMHEGQQEKAPGQRVPLETYRERSTIPVAGEGGGTTWTYPSEQQFYNALRRKGWRPSEMDVPGVVRIHNAVNEESWRRVAWWEQVAGESRPALAEFRGRGSSFSPKARFKNALGYTLPFDRHDWLVQRSDGSLRRYVIDFYQGRGSPEKVHIDARPAIDSPSAAFERLRGSLYSSFRRSEASSQPD